MAKHWQEREFLEYKERRIRRRTRRALDGAAGGRGGDGGAVSPADSAGGLKWVLWTLVVLALLGAGAFSWWLHTASGTRLYLRVDSVRGGVEISGLPEVRRGAVLEEGAAITTDQRGELELGVGLQGVRVTVMPSSCVVFRELRQGRRVALEFKLDFEVQSGEVVFELMNETNGASYGIARVVIPQGVELCGKLVHFKVCVEGMRTRTIVASGVLLARKDGRKVFINADQEMVSTDSKPLGKPRFVNVLRERWK